MVGFDYENFTQKDYLEKINGVEILKYLHFFLVNVLNLIFSGAYYYCYCKKINKTCAFYKIKVDFGGFEEKVNNNQDNKQFLKASCKKLLPYLLQIFVEDKTAVDCFSDDEYTYNARDWCTGQA